MPTITSTIQHYSKSPKEIEGKTTRTKVTRQM